MPRLGTRHLAALHGPGDPYLNLWILGWDLDTLPRAPADAVTGRVFDAPIFHPARQTLTYSDHFLVVAVLAWPFYALTGSAVFAYNVVLVLSLLASALAMHVFAREVTGSRWGGAGRRHRLGVLAVPLRAPRPHPAPGDLRDAAGRAGAASPGGASPPGAAALALGAAGAFQAATSIYYGVIGAVGAAVSLVSLIVATGGRRTAHGAALRVAVAAIVGGHPRGAVRLALPAGAAARGLHPQPVRGGAPRRDAGQLRQRARRQRRLRPHAVWLRTDRGAEHELFPGVVVTALAIYGLVVARRRGSGPLAAAAAATLVTGFVLSLGPDGVRALYATLHA